MEYKEKNMKLGFCGGVDLASSIRSWGYDYVELALAPLAQQTDEEFAASLKTLKESGLPCLACNVFCRARFRSSAPRSSTRIARPTPKRPSAGPLSWAPRLSCWAARVHATSRLAFPAAKRWNSCVTSRACSRGSRGVRHYDRDRTA